MAHLALWSLLGDGAAAAGCGPLSGLVTPRTSLPESPTFTLDGSEDQGDSCACSKAMTILRALHIEGLPSTMTAAELSALMAPYGSVQYAEAAPEAIKGENGELVRKLHCYVVFTDHAGACAAKRVLIEQAAAVGADLLRVRFCKPQHVAALCTPTFRAFVMAQWGQCAALAKAHPEYKKASCKVNALFVSKLHQHVTTARLTSLFGKFGKMLACEVQYHSDGRSAGHGVVIYETIEDAEKALAGTNGYRLEGRTIEVTPLRLKKLPSKLEHMKHRIKRQPLAGGEMSGSEDGSGSFPACSPKSLVSTPPTPAAASAAALMGLNHHQQHQQQAAAAAAAALQLQQGFMQGLQHQMLMQQVQQQMAVQAHMAAAAAAAQARMPPPPPHAAAAAAMAAAAAAAMGSGGGAGGPMAGGPHAFRGGMGHALGHHAHHHPGARGPFPPPLGHHGAIGGPRTPPHHGGGFGSGPSSHNGVPHQHAHQPHAEGGGGMRPGGDSMPAGLDLSFIS